MAKKLNKQAKRKLKYLAKLARKNKVVNQNPDNDNVRIWFQNDIDYVPKVSIIIPVYNVEPFLRECLESVINQTLKEIEIICVDDGSADKSLDVLKEYAACDKRITVIGIPHTGSGRCRNIALDIVKGEYVGFVDPDDNVETEYFEKLYNATLESAPDIVFQTSRIEFYPDGKQITISTTKNANDMVFRFNIIQESGHLWSKIFKSNFIKEYQLRNAYTRRSQDLMFTVPAILFANQIVCIDNAKYFYRKGHVSVTSKSYYAQEDIDQQFGLYESLNNKILQYKPQYSFFIKYKRNLLFKRIYSESSAEMRKIITDKIGMDYFTDFECRVKDSGDTIAIKNPSPMGLDKLWWGDYWLGLDLEQGLKQQGFNARTDYYGEWDMSPSADINLVIRGPKQLNIVDPSKINILYLMSFIKSFQPEELDKYDIIIVASERFKHIRRDKKVYYLPQFTNPNRFYPEYDEACKTDVLFVGNAYGDRIRPSVKNCLENNIPVSVYGKFWDNLIDKDYIRGDFIDNNLLHKYYSSAAIVLNDTTAEMRENGIVSNRIFDVTACKGFVISDYVPEIKKLYGDAVPMYKNEKEFGELIRYYLSHPEERRKKAEKAYKITLEHYTNKVFAENIQKIVGKYHKKISRQDYQNMLTYWYEKTTGNKLNIEKPKTYNEKLQWLKLYDATPLKTLLADKYLVRDWVAEKIGKEYLVPIHGVYDSFDEIDFSKLPKQFVLKTNHGSGWNIIVKDKNKFNKAEAKEKMDRWMSKNFAFAWGFELHYRDIKPKIVIEKFIDPGESDHEIQIWCFSGKIKFVSVESIKDEENLVRGTFYPNGKPTEFAISPAHYKKLEKITDKKAFNKALELAEKMLVDVPYVRIDFIEWHGSVRFREMTFTSGSGLSVIEPEKYNKVLGDWIDLPKLAYDMDTGKRYKLPKPKKHWTIEPYLLFPYYLRKRADLQNIYNDLNYEKASEKLKIYRIDIVYQKRSGAVDVSGDVTVIKPQWLGGVGAVVSSDKKSVHFNIACSGDGVLIMDFRGRDIKVNGKRLHVYVKYASIKIDGQEILEKPVSAWHDEPFRYNLKVSDNQVVGVDVEMTMHDYTPEELFDLLDSLFPSMETKQLFVQNYMKKLKDVQSQE